MMGKMAGRMNFRIALAMGKPRSKATALGNVRTPFGIATPKTHIARRPLPDGGRCRGCRLWEDETETETDQTAHQPAFPGTVSPRSEHPRVSITPASATSPIAQAAIM